MLIVNRTISFGCSYLLAATPLTVVLALHGVVKLPVAVHVNENAPAVNVIVLVVDTTVPVLSVHCKVGSG